MISHVESCVRTQGKRQNGGNLREVLLILFLPSFLPSEQAMKLASTSCGFPGISTDPSRAEGNPGHPCRETASAAASALLSMSPTCLQCTSSEAITKTLKGTATGVLYSLSALVATTLGVKQCE